MTGFHLAQPSPPQLAASPCPLPGTVLLDGTSLESAECQTVKWEAHGRNYGIATFGMTATWSVTPKDTNPDFRRRRRPT
ncbi:MAG: hypothetical protein ACK5RL_02575 [Acidimicrobiales bacterium]